ncbi:MAG: hypothetical protein K2K03_05470 [Prevotella sp.]|nr:hypothetical protein [Prevotella sp.]
MRCRQPLPTVGSGWKLAPQRVKAGVLHRADALRSRRERAPQRVPIRSAPCKTIVRTTCGAYPHRAQTVLRHLTHSMPTTYGNTPRIAYFAPKYDLLTAARFWRGRLSA